MSTNFTNVLTVSGAHNNLVEFVNRNLMLRRDVDPKYASKVPLFALGALVPKPMDADCEWAEKNWGCRFDTDSLITLSNMNWRNDCTSIEFVFETSDSVPFSWFYKAAAQFPALRLSLSCMCATASYAVDFDAENGEVSWKDWSGADFWEECSVETDPNEEEIHIPYQVPKDPDRSPAPRGFSLDCNVKDCLVCPPSEVDTIPEPPDSALDDGGWFEIQPENSDCGAYPFPECSEELPPLDFSNYEVPVDEEAEFEAVDIKRCSSPQSGRFPLQSAPKRATFTWRGFTNWPAGIVQDTSNCLHVLCCVRRWLGLPEVSLADLSAYRSVPRSFEFLHSWDCYAPENL